MIWPLSYFRRRAARAFLFRKISQEESDQIAKDIRLVFDAQQARVESDAERLRSIVKAIAAELGAAPILVNEKGEAFMHSRLQAELTKPGNEELLELLQMGLSAARPPESN